MPFNEQLAARIRALLERKYSPVERKMFGGLAFMVNGHMCCGIIGEDLVVRTGPDACQRALSRPHARPMDFTGRPMQGFVFVAPKGYRSDADLNAWTQCGLDFVLRKPPK